MQFPFSNLGNRLHSSLHFFLENLHRLNDKLPIDMRAPSHFPLQKILLFLYIYLHIIIRLHAI